jgi:hypothetical protein
VDCVDVASNVAIRDRRDAAGQRATAPDEVVLEFVEVEVGVLRVERLV